MAVPNVEELRKLPDEELIAAHDRLAKNTDVGISYYLTELDRRNQARQTEAMLKYTRQITWMTAAVTIATIINLIVAVLMLVRQ